MTADDLLAFPVVQVLFTGQGAGGALDVTDEVLPAGHSSEGNQFSYSSEGKWQFNLNTKNFSAPGEYEILLMSADLEEYLISPMCVGRFVVE